MYIYIYIYLFIYLFIYIYIYLFIYLFPFDYSDTWSRVSCPRALLAGAAFGCSFALAACHWQKKMRSAGSERAFSFEQGHLGSILARPDAPGSGFGAPRLDFRS